MALKRKSSVIVLIILIFLFTLGVCFAGMFLAQNITNSKKISINSSNYQRVIDSAFTSEEISQAVNNNYFSLSSSDGYSDLATSYEIIEDTEYYYGLRVSWNEGEDANRKYSDNALSFKKKYYEYKFCRTCTNGNASVNKFNTINKDVIKAVFDAKYKIKNHDSSIWIYLGSKVDDIGDVYKYTMNYKHTFDDENEQDEYIVTVDKNTGEVTREDE